MWKACATATLAAVLLALAPAHADEDRAEHYSGKPAPNLETAVENLRAYNAKLEELLSKEMTAENMDRVHRVSYTLETALQRLDKDLGNIANVLEGMHLASESLDADEVKANGESYLKNMRMLLGTE
jgi:hypothetical protein